jgi:RNA polymerase sigma-70 factor (ECF subfamily)
VDEDQFAAMFAELYPVVLGYAARRTDWHVAEDVASQALTVAWHRADVLPEDPDARSAWLIVVARNLLANSQRARLRAARLDVRLRAGLAAGVPIVEIDPAEIVTDRILASTVMRKLPPRDQEILQLVAWDGLDLVALGRVLGCTPTTAAMRLHRARHRLERLIHAGHAFDDDALGEDARDGAERTGTTGARTPSPGPRTGEGGGERPGRPGLAPRRR